ncbi:tetratricopeptide repeat protein [Actinoallomurus sp. NBC_01490]|uniref:tetratricopeptide repeat protein n=1 Tax=Actinoallomurus sp. NBC_01490 TaxID=2903557 RepID=UPI002E35E083|nr:tetratricopeptide repeat protein [Actinoallomurus sp. NBC_01490]
MTSISSYQALDEVARDSLDRLCLWGGPHFTLDIVAALFEVPKQEAVERLTHLVKLELIDRDEAERYRLCEDIRARMREPAVQSDRGADDAALARAIHRLIVEAASADYRLCPEPPRHSWAYGRVPQRPTQPTDAAEAFAWLDAEVGNLVYAQQAAVGISQDELAVTITETLGNWLDSRRPHDLWETVCDRGIAAARRCGLRLAEAGARLLLCRAYQDTGDFERAREQAEGALRLSQEAGDWVGEAAGLGQVGALHLADGDAEQALPILNGALDIVGESLECTWLSALLRRQIAEAEAMAGHIDKARADFRLAVHAFAARDHHQHGRALTELGAAEIEAGHDSRAIVALSEASWVLQICGRPFSSARAHYLLAQAHQNTGQRQEASLHIAQALEHYRGAGTAECHPGFADALRLAADLAGQASA